MKIMQLFNNVHRINRRVSFTGMSKSLYIQEIEMEQMKKQILKLNQFLKVCSVQVKI